MESYSSTDIIKAFKEKNISLFSLLDFGRLFNIGNQNTLYKKIQRLEKKGIVKKLIKGKYLFILNRVNDFSIGNFLFRPSYISLESALSFYGIITGFPYKITSLTTKKSREFMIGQKEYTYSHIDQDLFWGYEKKEDFLLAEKEKALLDLLYFQTKGLRSLDWDELDLKEIDKKKLIYYGKKFNSSKMLKILQELNYDY
ncbi:hypothetical protein A3A74_03040 [Candidatus Roizmanbacteria bacterium RIFCSPLOWO2_01_FULL_35_13]|uniref:AbiEi antitoxin C-terminal domain-containing protein n=1 Tax=Candidatus Roizmanbacteria bacterium RIFCSPLOWO2_01_FULL_35_13 TaxID=1802055 RepID=A0A1F7I8Z2_9BACT|nr:MAG: hypothetical protein A3A74_03040 [Candidatus Roizmanbacteria bacterium RIFCSPLOWO2_01_FULL_35_13]